MRGVVIAAVLALLAQPALPCACIERPVHENALDSDAVFEAMILTVRETAVRAQVIRVWKGDLPDRVTISQEPGNCQFPFAAGHRYVIYANGNYETNLCSGTKESSDASADLRVLGTGKRPAASVLGFRLKYVAAAGAVALLLIALVVVRRFTAPTTPASASR